MLLIAGLQEPVMPSMDVVGSGGIVAPEQYGPIAANVGMTCGSMVISIVIRFPHCDGSSGAKV